MVAKSPKKMKVTTAEERERKKQERERNGEYFEKFMIEIGQWKKSVGGGIEMSGNYIPSEEIQTRFKAWLKKAK